jgi:osmotically-inducible protein OsmY
MLKLLAGAAAGFAAAWFLDSKEGANRRDKALKYFRQGKEEAVRTAGAAAGPVKGAAAKVTPGAGRPDAAERLNDPALQAKVESEVFRAASAPKDRVSVNVADGIV